MVTSNKSYGISADELNDLIIKAIKERVLIRELGMAIGLSCLMDIKWVNL